MKRLFAILLVFGFFIVGNVQQVRAAPQILGVIAYNDPVPLSCAAGQCWAELVTVCLQKHRDNPLAGAQYEFFGEGEANLVVTDAKGGTRTLPASDHVRIKVARGFTAVRVEMTERAVRELGAAQIALTVDKGMSLIPLPVAGDPNPITEHEIAYTTDFLRREADRWLDADDERAHETVMVNRMINMTPRVARMTVESRASLMTRAEQSISKTISVAGRQRAAATFESCRYMVEDLGRFYSMRRCLQTKHDNAMINVNTEYWRATTPGS